MEPIDGAKMDAIADAVKHYLARTGHILMRLSAQEDKDDLLTGRLSPDMFDTGFNLAIAIQFAARCLCPPAGQDVPDIPEEFTFESLSAYHAQVSQLLAPIKSEDLTHLVSHVAGEAELCQDPDDYVTRFAFPNMIFHLTIAYAGLRRGGMSLGKADFDGLHRY